MSSFNLQQLSQFWYDDITAVTLAKEALRVGGEEGRYVKHWYETLMLQAYDNYIDIRMHTRTHTHTHTHPPTHTHTHAHTHTYIHTALN